jgi:hypothetical protein
MLPTKFWFIWSSGFRGEDFKKIGQSETRIVSGGHVEPKLRRKHIWQVLNKIAYFVQIRYQTWPPQTILLSDWLISKNLLLLNRLPK